MDLRTLAADTLHDVRALDTTRPVTLTGPDGGRPASAPTLPQNADGHLELFATGDGSISHIRQTATGKGWADWTSLGRPGSSGEGGFAGRLVRGCRRWCCRKRCRRTRARHPPPRAMLRQAVT